MKASSFTCFILLVLWFMACNQSADSPETASEYLTKVPHWGISEVYVNDALNFKDGKEVANFGGISFSRYMESVSFLENGTFLGNFAGADTTTMLYWTISPDQQNILVTADDTLRDARSAWNIAPRDVHKDTFEMTTETAAFDYPRVTRIRLKFVAKE